MMRRLHRSAVMSLVFALAGVAAGFGLASATESILPFEPHAVAIGSVYVSADGRTLTVPHRSCGEYTLLDGVNDTAVTLRLMVRGAIDCGPDSSYSVTLADPLGSRRIVNTSVDRALPVAGGILRPVTLPPGFTHSHDSAVFGSGGTDAYTQVFATADGAPDMLTIAQHAGTGGMPSAASSPQPVTVRGVAGVAVPGEIDWIEHGQRFAIRSQAYGYDTLSTVQLVAIAASLR